MASVEESFLLLEGDELYGEGTHIFPSSSSATDFRRVRKLVALLESGSFPMQSSELCHSCLSDAKHIIEASRLSLDDRMRQMRDQLAQLEDRLQSSAADPPDQQILEANLSILTEDTLHLVEEQRSLQQRSQQMVASIRRLRQERQAYMERLNLARTRQQELRESLHDQLTVAGHTAADVQLNATRHALPANIKVPSDPPGAHAIINGHRLAGQPEPIINLNRGEISAAWSQMTCLVHAVVCRLKAVSRDVNTRYRIVPLRNSPSVSCDSGRQIFPVTRNASSKSLDSQLQRGVAALCACLSECLAASASQYEGFQPLARVQELGQLFDRFVDEKDESARLRLAGMLDDADLKFMGRCLAALLLKLFQRSKKQSSNQPSSRS